MTAWDKTGPGPAMLLAQRDEQAGVILDLLNSQVSLSDPIIIVSDASDPHVVVVRLGSATWRGSSVRDALANMLQSLESAADANAEMRVIARWEGCPDVA